MSRCLEVKGADRYRELIGKGMWYLEGWNSMKVTIANRAQSPMPGAALKAHAHLMPLTWKHFGEREREKRRREGCLILVICPSCEYADEGMGDRLRVS